MFNKKIKTINTKMNSIFNLILFSLISLFAFILLIVNKDIYAAKLSDDMDEMNIFSNITQTQDDRMKLLITKTFFDLKTDLNNKGVFHRSIVDSFITALVEGALTFEQWEDSSYYNKSFTELKFQRQSFDSSDNKTKSCYESLASVIITEALTQLSNSSFIDSSTRTVLQEITLSSSPYYYVKYFTNNLKNYGL
ncbi:MAG: putative secreted protein [Candidatus Phytoplasma cynodontis]|nr:MAG: putative secreted protein [Candidatus Phytoplasma cynodontis]